MICFNNLDEAISYGFDGFVVSTPSETHFSIAQKILNNNFSVLVEKPITLNTTDAKILIKDALNNNVNIMVGHVLLFHPAFEKIKEMIENGELGDIQYMYSNRLNLGTIRAKENVFWSLAPHDIALFQWLTNSFPNRINSNGIDFLQNGVNDTTITTLEYPNRLMGHIYVSWLHPFKEHRFVVIGTKGMIRFEDSAEGKPLTFYDKSIEWEKGKPIPKHGNTKIIEYESDLALTRELQYFINNLNKNNLKKCNGESALDVIKILENATLSLNSDEK